MDVPDEHRAAVRGVPHQRAGHVPASHVVVWGGVDAFYERVVGVWDDEVGGAACRAGVREFGELGVDVVAEGILFGVVEGRGRERGYAVWRI